MRKILITLLTLFSFSAIAQEDIILDQPITSDTEVYSYGSITLRPGFSTSVGVKFTAKSLKSSEYVISPSKSYNYVHAIQPIKALNEIEFEGLRQASEVNENLTYFDGLGRNLQSVNVKSSAALNDQIVPTEYDEYGRVVKEYLPYTINSSAGSFQGNAIQAQNTFYQTQANIAHTEISYSEKYFENSPLNRITEQGASGESWQINKDRFANSDRTGNTIKYNYESNTDGEVKLWEVHSNSDCEHIGYYAANTLYKNEIIDENGNSTFQYKDFNGNVILKKSIEGANELQTYYIYDKFNRLRYVLPPKSMDVIRENEIFRNNDFDELIYYYEYDKKGRIIEKKIPGAETIYMVYDNRGRLVLTQDGEMRNQSKWNFTKYDELNRPIITGVIQIAGQNQSQLISSFAAHTGNNYETVDLNQNYGYTLNNSYPSTIAITENDLLTINYYDNYDFISDYGYTFNLPTGFDFVNAVSQPFDLITATIEWNLDDPTEYFVSVNYYDEYLRLVQTISENQLNGVDILTQQYDFVGNVTQTKLEHTVDASVDPNVKSLWQFNSYDHTGRLSEVYHQYGDNVNNRILMVQYKYNELGELIEKNLHSENNGSSFLQDINYAYNIRGWLTNINDADLSDNDDLFGFELVYNNPVTDIDSTIEENYNGNITGIFWNTNGTFKEKRGYGFKYDNINRLTDAYYGDNSNWTSGLYNEQGITYDLNGNIKSISRNAGATNGEIDKLDYVYNGNKLLAIRDVAAGEASLGFKDGVASSAGNEYLYDDNGNMIDDANKGLSFNYNILNLVSSVSKGTQRFNIHYDANGEKLSTSLDIAPMKDTRYYIGPFKYLHHKQYPTLPGGTIVESFDLEHILTPEGRIIFGGAGEVNYEYFLKDHLGNTRVVFADYDDDGTAEIIQEDSYYPFGMQMADLSERAGGVQPNQYLYNGKELHEEMDLDWYDYGARMYDPALGRWQAMDPLGEERISMTPYNYVSNNPILRIDPDGMLDDEWDYEVESGKMEWKSDKGGSERQYVNIKEDGKQIGEASVSGDKVYAYKMRNSVFVTNKDRLFDDKTYNSESGYEYTAQEFKIRNKYIESGSVFKTAILSSESQGKPFPITYKEEEKKYGYTVMRLKMMLTAIELGMHSPEFKAPTSSTGVSRVGKLNLGSTSNFKSGIYGYKGAASLTGKTSWNKFLQANKGKYSGKGWQRKAAADYYNSNFYKP